MTEPAPRHVVIVAFDDFQMLDVTGPAEVFSQATRLVEGRSRAAARAGYRLHVVAPREGEICASSGLALVARRLSSAPRRADTLIVSGGRGVAAAARDRALSTFLSDRAARARRVASVCSGAFLLARSGLLDGRAATTHWESAELLARLHPRVRVEPDRIFVKDGNVYTSAGVTAGIDLALALVADDHGRALALEVARQMVVFLKRPGGQSQFSNQLRTQASENEPLAELCAWIEDHVDLDLRVPALAKHAGMSARNFARRFIEATGTTPARYVHRVRLAAARRRLEESSGGLDRVAAETGFGSADALRRVFVSELGVTPSGYRERFFIQGATP